MAAVHADIDAIRNLREAFDRYQFEQRQVFADATHEIDSTRASLERKAEKWRLRLEQLRDEYRRCQILAASAAEHGGYVDCSGYPPAIDEAQERLTNVGIWQTRVENEIAVYEGVRSRFHECVEIDLRHAYVHLTEVIQALIEVRATGLRHNNA